MDSAAWALCGCVSCLILPSIVLVDLLLWEVDLPLVLPYLQHVASCYFKSFQLQGEGNNFQTCSLQLVRKAHLENRGCAIHDSGAEIFLWDVSVWVQLWKKLKFWHHSTQRCVQDRNSDNSDNEGGTPNKIRLWCLKQKLLICLNSELNRVGP